MKSFTLIVIVCLFLLSCGPINSRYKAQPTGSFAGYGYGEISTDGSNSAYTVHFLGTSTMHVEKVGLYAQFRCSELTKEHGLNYFIVDHEDTVVNEYMTDQAHTSYFVSKKIRMFQGTKPQIANAFDADSLIALLTSQIER